MATGSSLRDVEDVHHAFRRFLKSRRIKVTRARLVILDAVQGLKEHFEADQLLDVLKRKGETVGKATVYRTLPLLVDSGILKKVRFDEKRAHFQFAFGTDPHDHLVCNRCGQIIEFKSDDVAQLGRTIGRQHHFHVIGHRLQLMGLCWECSTKCPVAVQFPPGRNTPPQR